MRFYYKIVFTAMICWLSLAIMSSHSPQQQKRGPMTGEQIGRSWFQSVKRLSSADFTEVAFQTLPDDVIGESQRWSENFLNKASNPYDVPHVHHSIHLSDSQADDLLRHEYDAMGKHIVATESSAIYVVEISASGFGLSSARSLDIARVVNSLAEAFIKTTEGPDGPEGPYGQHSWHFQSCDSSPQEIWFCTNPQADPIGMQLWVDRADANLQGQTLWFLFYKKYRQILGPYGNPQKWFPNDFRRKYANNKH